MRVVLSSYTFPPEVGGVATHVATLSGAFARAGHETAVITSVAGETQGYPFEVLRAPDPLTLARRYRQADILVLSNLSLRLAYPALTLRRPFGLWHHSESAREISSSALSLGALRKELMRRAVHFATSRYIAARLGLGDCVVIPPFIGREHQEAFLPRPVSARSGVLFAGRLEPEKGILGVLDRWSQIRDRLGAHELRIAGTGSLMPEIVRRVSSGMPQVRLLGALSLAAVAREIGRAAYAIVPSLWNEPFGSAALESIAGGAITIASRRGGLCEAVGDLGFVYDPDDEASFDGALSGARQRLMHHAASPRARAGYEAAVARHIAAFDPAPAVDKIIGALTRSPSLRLREG